MNRDPRLERYLSTLENALKPFPVSDRAEIITEIKSHVMSALERDPQASVDGILAALGEPEIVANRYLLERGLKPGKPPISPIVRWMVIGFLGTIAMLLAFAAFVITRGPVVKIDEKANSVEVLGGMIKIDGDKEHISIKAITRGHTFSGTMPMNEGQPFAVNFKDGHVSLSTSPTKELSWECHTDRRDGRELDTPEPTNGTTIFDLTSLEGVMCQLKIPANVKMKVEGEDGRIVISRPTYDIEANLERGNIEFESARGSAYKFDVKVESGQADEFVSSDKPDARNVKLRLNSGRIGHDD